MHAGKSQRCAVLVMHRTGTSIAGNYTEELKGSMGIVSMHDHVCNSIQQLKAPKLGVVVQTLALYKQCALLHTPSCKPSYLGQ